MEHDLYYLSLAAPIPLNDAAIDEKRVCLAMLLHETLRVGESSHHFFSFDFEQQHSMNRVGDVGAAALADAFRSPLCTLARLDLRYNQVK